MADRTALGIAVESPQQRHEARTCNGKPDPCGNAQLLDTSLNKFGTLEVTKK